MNKNDEIIKELKEIAPTLAELKQDIKTHSINDSYIDELMTNINLDKDGRIRNKELPLRRLIGIAASVALLVGAIAIITKQDKSQIDNSFIEAYVDDNLDDFEPYIFDDLRDLDLVEESTISEELIMAYLEENLDEIDLEFFYD